jgi:hypothetical protein
MLGALLGVLATLAAPYVAPGPSERHFTVENRLATAVSIATNGIERGSVEAGCNARIGWRPCSVDPEQFTMSDPVETVRVSIVQPWAPGNQPPSIEWEVRNVTNGQAVVLDLREGAYLDPRQEWTLTDILFYPIVANSTSEECGVVVNLGLEDEYRPNGWVFGGPDGEASDEPFPPSVDIGYFVFHDYVTNVVLSCPSSSIWWGPVDPDAESAGDETLEIDDYETWITRLDISDPHTTMSGPL